jgi:hypothetical protein
VKHFIPSLLRKDPYERLMAGEVLQHIGLFRKTNVVESVKNKEINTNVLQDMYRLVYASAVSRIALGMSSQ